MLLYVAEMDPGIDDEVVLNQANENNAILITADKDFGELVYRRRLINQGVILLRLAGLSDESKAQIATRVIRQHESDLPQSFTVISPGMVRVRPRG